MNDIEKLLNILPPIKELDFTNFSEPVSYIGVVGFEDRALAFLNKANLMRLKFNQIILIEYKPDDERNKKKDFVDTLRDLDIPIANINWIVYDRYKPQEFLDNSALIIDNFSKTTNVVVDISAMSKLLIVILLQIIRFLKIIVNIVYTEAEVYHPIQKEFEAQKEVFEKETDNLPIFLTSDIYDIVTTTSLSTTAMQGYPLLIVAFPTFNHSELTALVTESIPQHLILLEGKPHEPHNNWRLDAIKWLNRKIIEHIGNGETLTQQERIISTFDFVETIKILEKIYQLNKYYRKIIIVPTGSKLQTFGVFLFKQMHPDIQIIYPVTKEFKGLYTEGVNAMWQIQINNFSELITQLDRYRMQGLEKLRNLIEIMQ